MVLASGLLEDGRGAEAQPLLDEMLPRLREAAEAGVAEAMFLLSDVYRQGLGVEKDVDEAIVWATKALDRGHPGADFSLGVCYLDKGEK